MIASAKQGSIYQRRLLLAAAGAVATVPSLALSSVFRCDAQMRVAVLAPLTGPLASSGTGYLEGAQQAVRSVGAQGCAVSLVALDAFGASQMVAATARAAQFERASVILAPYGAVIADVAAARASNALVVDLLQTSPLKAHQPNLVAVPYTELFFTSDPGRRRESLRSVGRVAVTIVLETIRGASQGSIRTPSELIDAMAIRRFEIPGGTVVLNRESGAFQRTQRK